MHKEGRTQYIFSKINVYNRFYIRSTDYIRFISEKKSIFLPDKIRLKVKLLQDKTEITFVNLLL